MLSRLRGLPYNHPLAFGIAISATKTGAADVMAQVYLEGRPVEGIDGRRTVIFFTWGALWLGGVQYFLYNHLFARVLFPSVGTFVSKSLVERMADRAGQRIVVMQVGLDQLVHHPFFLFPAFYCVKETIERGVISHEGTCAALLKYRANIWNDCLMCWKWWVPTFLLNFSLAPLHLRVPITAVVSFAFTSAFSFQRGARQKLTHSDDR
jgi:hypothetical protein